VERKEAIHKTNLPPYEIRDLLRRQNNLMDDQTKHYNDTKTRINNRPRIKGGIFREMINVELTIETRRAFIQTLKEWLLGKK
jgi:hypothetical protein